MNVLSLFDGISCGMLALERACINVEKYYAAEIDKYAIKISENNYPNIIRLGDVNNWKEWGIDWTSIDLLIGGSPCQGFSFAGKRLAFDDPRSKLFFVFVDILNHIKKHNSDVKFLLENVKMAEEHLNVISYYLNTDPVLINSALVSAQNRERYYWANWEIEQPEDQFIFLKDVIEGAAENDSICSPSWHKWWDKNREFQERKKYSQSCNDKEKALTLTARMYASWNGNFIKLEANNDQEIKIGIEQRARGKNRGNVFYSKSPTLTSSRWEENNRLILVGEANINGNDSIKRIYSVEGKAPTLSSCNDGHQEPKIKTNSPGDYKKGIDKNGNEIYWRKLTPIECERLQTLPDNYTDSVSNSQRYKCIGNAWTVDVISHIFSTMHVKKYKQERLFA